MGKVRVEYDSGAFGFNSGESQSGIIRMRCWRARLYVVVNTFASPGAEGYYWLIDGTPIAGAFCPTTLTGQPVPVPVLEFGGMEVNGRPVNLEHDALISYTGAFNPTAWLFYVLQQEYIAP